jgi:large subunit ribosomal protein L18
MSAKSEDRRLSRMRRHRRIRKRIQGTAERPRVAIFRSLKHLYVQVIDDVTARTLISASTLDKEARGQLGSAESRMDRSKQLGKLLAERAKGQGITQVAFDRGGYLYHGHVKALADGAREGGLDF